MVDTPYLFREDFERKGEAVVTREVSSYIEAERKFAALDWLEEKRRQREQREEDRELRDAARFRKMLFVTIVAALAAVVGAVAAIWAGAVAKGWM